MKKLMAFLSCLLVSAAALMALPMDLEFGMDIDDIDYYGLEYEASSLDDLGPFQILKFDPDNGRSQTWYETYAVMSEEDGIISIFTVQGFPENSKDRRLRRAIRLVAEEYGTPLDMFEYAEDHPLDEDLFFLALIGGITDEDLVRELGLSFLATLFVENDDDTSQVWVSDDDSLAAVASVSNTEIVSVWIAPDVLHKVAGSLSGLLISEMMK